MREINYNFLTDHIKEGMKLYIEHGILPGGFLQSVICNDLVHSFAAADSLNIERMFYIAKFVYAEMPSKSWGSYDKMLDWHMAGGLIGIKELPENKSKNETTGETSG